MLSSFPTMLCSDKFFETPSPAFEGGFTPWDDFQEPPFCFQQDDPIFGLNPTQEPVFSNSGSDNSNPIIPISSNSCSNDENRNSSTSGSDDPPIIDERKRRRMISNRESARRSRMRKQKQLETLRNQVNRFKVGNWEMMNRLRLVTHHSQIILKDNERLRCELVMLRQRLWEIHQVLLVQRLQQPLASSAWPCNNVTSINEQQTTTTLMT